MDCYEKYFAHNISRLRASCDLTQREFANMLGYSEKAVSKWECVGSVPSISTLYQIAALLHVTLDDLFRAPHTYLLGIDGGGTKTDFILSDENLHIVKSVTLDGCNPIDIGLHQAKEILKRGICEVCEGIPFSSIVMFAGIAGGSSGNMKRALEKFFRGYGFQRFENGSDTQNILSAALGEDDGVIAILGTGNCAIARHGGVQERVSGWGYLFEGGGSGYSIARDALAAAFCYIDGSGEHTVFADEVLKQYATPQDLLGALYDGGKRFIASFSPLVFACAERGDAVCRRIIKDNMDFALDVIRTAVEKVPRERVRVVAAGGLSREAAVCRHLARAFVNDSKIEFSVLEEQPVKGALLYAKKLADEVVKV